jgi:hypothetical protein
MRARHYWTLSDILGRQSGQPGGTRTPDIRLRRSVLYPVELRAGGGNRGSWRPRSTKARWALSHPARPARIVAMRGVCPVRCASRRAHVGRGRRSIAPPGERQPARDPGSFASSPTPDGDRREPSLCKQEFVHEPAAGCGTPCRRQHTKPDRDIGKAPNHGSTGRSCQTSDGVLGRPQAAARHRTPD